jgi:hypothetical protein
MTLLIVAGEDVRSGTRPGSQALPIEGQVQAFQGRLDAPTAAEDCQLSLSL